MTTVVEAETPEATSKRIPGEAGAWIFILGDMCVFGIFFVVYLSERAKHLDVFAQSQETLNPNFGAINTVFLLVSSLFVVLAVRAMRIPTHRRLAAPLIAGAFVCGVSFVIVKFFEYHDKIAAGVTPQTNDFYMYYFVLTGLHLFHLICGLAVLIILWRFARKPRLSRQKWGFFEAGACFWHMVDLLWIVIFPLLFLVR